MPLNKLPVKQTEKICPRCNSFLAYQRSYANYVCEYCGAVYQKEEILAENVKRKKKIEIPTRRKQIEAEYGDLLNEMANYEPEASE